jgi:hypothetical protein
MDDRPRLDARGNKLGTQSDQVGSVKGEDNLEAEKGIELKRALYVCHAKQRSRVTSFDCHTEYTLTNPWATLEIASHTHLTLKEKLSHK